MRWSSTTRCRSTSRPGRAVARADRRRLDRISSTSSACSRLLGRTFRAEDDSPDAPAVLVLSDAYWRRALGGDPAVVGRTFEMNGRVHTAIGVLPPMPQFPAANDVYMPPSACPFRSNPETIANRNARMLTAIGRLRPGATLEQVQGDLDAVSQPAGRRRPRRVRPAANRLSDRGADGARRADPPRAPDTARCCSPQPASCCCSLLPTSRTWRSRACSGASASSPSARRSARGRDGSRGSC